MEENAAAAKVTLTDEEVKKVRELVESVEVLGDRYCPLSMFSNFSYPEQMQGNLFADTPLPK